MSHAIWEFRKEEDWLRNNPKNATEFYSRTYFSADITAKVEFRYASMQHSRSFKKPCMNRTCHTVFLSLCGNCQLQLQRVETANSPPSTCPGACALCKLSFFFQRWQKIGTVRVWCWIVHIYLLGFQSPRVTWRNLMPSLKLLFPVYQLKHITNSFIHLQTSVICSYPSMQ